MDTAKADRALPAMQKDKKDCFVAKPPRSNRSNQELAAFCRRHHIRKLSLFGSVPGDAFDPDSDVDVLVEFEPGHTPGLSLIRMQDELSSLLGGRKVDLVTPKFLNRRIREKVMAEAKVVYIDLPRLVPVLEAIFPSSYRIIPPVCVGWPPG